MEKPRSIVDACKLIIHNSVFCCAINAIKIIRSDLSHNKMKLVEIYDKYRSLQTTQMDGMVIWTHTSGC
jgi:hypothetical protein